jgi:hypothetical protein
MKKFHLFLALAFSIASFGQGRLRQKLDQVKAQKVAFITNELQLTPDESAKFWPLYNAFDERQRDIRRQRVSAYLDRHSAGAAQLSDKEATALLAQMEENEDQLYQARKKLIADLKAILPAVKILKLKKAEEDFNKKLLQQIRDRRK